MSVFIKRIYEPQSPDDGHRVLVDRLWPRGIRKDNAQIDEWLKDVAPSPDLRKWFGHQPEKWEIFCKRYSDELKISTSFVQLKSRIKNYKTLTLIYSARDKQHNHAKVLQGLLQSFPDSNQVSHLLKEHI